MFEEEFEIQKLIGEGSFAKVYKCLEKESGNVYAVKELQIGNEASDMKTIREEMEIWKSLQHENIVSLHRTFADNSSFYLVCEYLESGSLFDEIVGQKVYSEDQARSITTQVRTYFINYSLIYYTNLVFEPLNPRPIFYYKLEFKPTRFLGKTKKAKPDLRKLSHKKILNNQVGIGNYV